MGITRGNIITLSISALLGITIYSIIYGVLEYFLFHSPNYDGWLKISKYFPNMYFYWSFMLLSAIGFTAIFCRHWIITLWSMWLFPVVEDLFFFISLGIHQQKYPFPVSNWYDEAFWIAKILKLGQPLTFVPYIPNFYFVLPLIYLFGIVILIVLQARKGNIR